MESKSCASDPPVSSIISTPNSELKNSDSVTAEPVAFIFSESAMKDSSKSKSISTGSVSSKILAFSSCAVPPDSLKESINESKSRSRSAPPVTPVEV